MRRRQNFTIVALKYANHGARANRRTWPMKLRRFGLVVVLAAAWLAKAQDAKGIYPSMAPLDQYLMERNAEIAPARSAAPQSISQDAEIMVLGQQSYQTAVQGKNGFVCLVERSWMLPYDDPEFWDAKVRLPLCLNPPAARSHLPLTFNQAELAFSGLSKTSDVRHDQDRVRQE
jgi:hypothetical protein